MIYLLNETQTIGFYCIIFFYSILNMYIAVKLKKNNNKIYYFFLFFSYFPLWLLIIFRNSSVGTDYISVGENYTRIINNSINIKKYNWFGNGLNIICKILGTLFGSNAFVFYFFIGTLTIIFLYKFLLNNCEYPTLSLSLFIVLGMYLQSFNQSRQILALVIILYASKYIKEKNIIKYVICILIAFIFHQSAIIFIPCYLLSKCKEKKQMKIIYVCMFLLIIFGSTLFEKIISTTKYAIYFTTQYNISNVKTSYLNLIVRIILMFFCLMFYSENKKNEIYNFSYHMIIICTLLQIVTLKYYFIARLTTYFFAFYIILLPKCIDELLKKIKSKSKKITCFLAIVIFMCSYFYVYYKAPSGALNSGYSKYGFIWNKK